RIDRELRVDADRLAQLEIILAMVGCHVNEAGALVGGDEIAGEERPRPGEEPAELVHGVANDGAREIGAFETGTLFVGYQLGKLVDCREAHHLRMLIRQSIEDRSRELRSHKKSALA